MALDLRTGIGQIDEAVKTQLLLAYGYRFQPPAATIAAIRSYDTGTGNEEKGSELLFCTANGLTYRFNRTSTAADDGDTIVRPTSNPVAGRWQKTTSTVKTGYAKQVRIHAGPDDYMSFLKRGLAARPSIHILFDGSAFKERSMAKGALYWVQVKYKIIAISSNLRFGAQAIEGSDVPTEATSDPGTHDIVGDINVSLAGSDLSTAGVAYVEIEQERFKTGELTGRLFFEEMLVTVYCTIHQPDVGLATIDALSGLYIQRQLLGGGSPYDKSNIVTSGYTVPTGSGFTKTPAAGVAVVGGTAVSSSPIAHTFTANKDTYRDLQVDGTFNYTAVANGANAPGIVGSSLGSTLRVGVTVTDGTGVIWDAMLASTLVNFEAVDIVPAAGLGVASIAITPSTATIASGATQKFTATATYASGVTKDISDVVTWVSSATSAATIDYTGLASWVATGSSTISCSYDGLAGGTATLTTS